MSQGKRYVTSPKLCLGRSNRAVKARFGGGSSRCGLARFGNEPPPAVSAKRLACDLPQLSLVEVTCLTLRHLARADG